MNDREAIPIEDPEVWVDLYGDYLYRFALSRIQDPTTAEDLVQETFLAALQARHGFQGRSSPRSWLTGILKHKIVDYFRKHGREQPTEDIELEKNRIDALFHGNGSWRVAPSRWTLNPKRLYDQKEFLDIFYRCLAKLPKRLARAFTLREIDGMSTEEIRKVMDISATNSWVILYRARMALRTCLEKRWIGAEAAENA
jgi:RNA polymerase sigma-70 factor, ECF subfamily